MSLGLGQLDSTGCTPPPPKNAAIVSESIGIHQGWGGGQALSVSSRRMWGRCLRKIHYSILDLALDGCKGRPEVLEAPLRIWQTVEADMDDIRNIIRLEPRQSEAPESRSSCVLALRPLRASA